MYGDESFISGAMPPFCLVGHLDALIGLNYWTVAMYNDDKENVNYFGGL